MLSVEEAEERIREALPRPVAARLTLDDALDRVLAETIRAPGPLPRFTSSSMDGYAVQAYDTKDATDARPAELRVHGEATAGHPAPESVGPGECTRCMTGAPIPAGADAVVMVEHTSGFGGNGTVRVKRPVHPGENLRRAGEEVLADDVLLLPGTIIGPVERSILDILGVDRVAVYRRPPTAVLVTGDEVVRPGRPLAPGEVHDTNLGLLTDLLRRSGAKVVQTAYAGDDPENLRLLLGELLDSCQILVVTGGISMGTRDHVPLSLVKSGVLEVFRGVAQKPGKPFLFGVRGGTLAFGLPGNPVSALVCFLRYVLPSVERITGREPRPPIPAILAAPFPRERDRHRWLPGRAWFEGGRVLCRPTDRTGSHMLTSALGANCLLGAGPGPDPLPAGAPIGIDPLPWTRCPEI